MLAGGHVVQHPGGGQFFAPTVLVNITPEMRIWRCVITHAVFLRLSVCLSVCLSVHAFVQSLIQFFNMPLLLGSQQYTFTFYIFMGVEVMSGC